MIGNDCTCSCKFNFHTTTTAQVQLRWKVIVLLISMEFMIITVYKLSFHINQWKELVCWKYVFLFGFIRWNLYLMWSSVNCRNNVRHIRTIPFVLPPDWDGCPLNSHRIFINYISFPFCAQIKLLTSISFILLNQPPMDKWWIKSLCM